MKYPVSPPVEDIDAFTDFLVEQIDDGGAIDTATPEDLEWEYYRDLEYKWKASGNYGVFSPEELAKKIPELKEEILKRFGTYNLEDWAKLLPDYAEPLIQKIKKFLPRGWQTYTDKDWVETFPEAEEQILNLYLERLDLLEKLKKDFKLTEELFSQDLNTRLMEEANLDATLGAAIKGLEGRVKTYRLMLSFFKKETINTKNITDKDIEIARYYPIINLLSESPKKHFIHCPFHSEKTPSCRVYSNYIHCYGCGKHVDSIGYIMETQGKSFINSVKLLCQK